MAFEIIDTPARNVSLNNKSFWGANFNPQVFLYQRKDFVVTAIDQGGGFAQLLITVNIGLFSITQQMIDAAPGTRIYIKTQNYEGLYPIIAIGQSFGTLYVTVSGVVQAVGVQTGFANIDILKPGYRFTTTVKIVSQGLNYSLKAKHSPNLQGICRVDLQAFLKAYTNAEDANNYNVLVNLDLNRFVKYSIAVNEEWQGNTDGVVDYNFDCYAIHAALQFNSLGSNFGAYVPFLVEINENKKAKFLTTINEPVITIGKPFDLGFIMTSEFAGKQIFVGYLPLNINKAVVAGGLASAALLANEVDHIDINGAGDNLLISGNTALVYQVAAQVGVNRLTILQSLLPDVAYLQVYLFYLNSANQAVRITEIKTLKVSFCDDKEGAYVKYLNLVGGWDYQLFDYRVEHSLDVTAQTYVDRLILDYSTQNTTQDVLSKEAQFKIQVGKNSVSKDQMKGLAGMLTSPKVYLLTNLNPYQWQTVTVDSKGTRLYDTLDGYGDFEATFRLPKLNLQTN